MARHNEVRLYGVVSNSPKIISNNEGEFLQGVCTIKTIRGKRSTSGTSLTVRYDDPIIIVTDPELGEIMKEIKKGDFVHLKGVLVTKNMEKIVQCPECHNEKVIQGTLTYVRPLFIEKTINVEDKSAIAQELRSRMEISNTCTLIGSVGATPEFYINEKGVHMTQYPLVTNRKYKLTEDATDIKTDFPYVKSYGTQADKDYQHLAKGYVVFVDGCIQTRDYEKEVICDCGHEFTWKDRTTEVVPYQNEYFPVYTEEL